MKKGKIIPINSERKIKEDRKCEQKHIISKEKFVEILEKLKTVHDTEEQINKVISENIEKMGCPFYEMDFGRREIKSFSITLEGEIIYLDTAEKLYDYLEKTF